MRVLDEQLAIVSIARETVMLHLACRAPAAPAVPSGGHDARAGT